MATLKIAVGTARTSLTTSAMNSLASGTYVSCGTITFEASSKRAVGAKIECKVTPGTVSGNKQVMFFARQSLDGTNFESGPTSGTTTTDEPNLTPIGPVPCNSNSTAQTRVFDLSEAFGDLPYAAEIIAKNDSGAALASSGHHVYYELLNGDST